MCFILKLVLFNIFLIFVNCSTTCKDSQKHYANLCFAPEPFGVTDFDWIVTRQATDGLHPILGNDITRLHIAEALKGELLQLSDNFDGMCLTVTVNVNMTSPDYETSVGNFFAFGNLTTTWNCKFSKDFELLFICDDVNPGVTKYHENFNSYISYTDYKNFVIEVYCFPNGHVGWLASAISRSFTEAEQKTIIDHITSIGFSNDNTVTLYDEKSCATEAK